MGLLSVLSWGMVRRVSLGRESSDGEILGANCSMTLLWLGCRMWVCTMLECICVEFAVIVVVRLCLGVSLCCWCS